MANFQLKSIEIKNFRSIKNQIFEIKDGLFVIIGDNKDNPGNNNGAGKTSIISACIWALTGTSLNGEVLADEIVNFKTGKDCKVKCIFYSDDGELIVTRTRKDSELGNNLIIELDGQDLSCHKIADTQTRLNNIIKVSPELLKSTIIMTSDMKSRFSDLNTQSRINLLESIRDYTLWSKIRDSSRLSLLQIDTTIKSNNKKSDEMIGSINTYESLIVSNEQAKVDILNKTKDIDIDDIIIKLEAQNEQFQQELSTIDLSTDKIDDLKTKITNLSQEKDNLIESIQPEIDKVSDYYNDLYNKETDNYDKLKLYKIDLLNKRTTFTNDIKNLEKDINNIKNWFINNTCPTCFKELDRTEEDITKNKAKLKELADQSKVLEENQDKNELEITKNEENLNILVKNRDDLIVQKQFQINSIKNKISDQIETLKTEIKSLNSDLDIEIVKLDNTKLRKITLTSNLEKNKLNIEKCKNQKELIKEKLSTLSTQNIDYKAKIEKLNTDKAKIDENNKTLQDKRELYNYFYHQLGPKGNLRPWLLAKDINFLNLCIKKYVHKFFEDIDVYLTKPTLDNNAINIIVECSDGIVKPVSSLSGGERKRVDLCIQLALYDLIRSTSLFNINFVCFDEVESALDSAGIRALIDIIDERKDIIPTILWISNREDVMECIPNKIRVIKQNGFSEVKYE